MDKSKLSDTVSKSSIFAGTTLAAQGRFIDALIKISYVLAILIVTVYLTPHNYRTSRYEYQPDQISEEEIIAPFTFDILKPDELLQSEQENAVRRVNSVVDIDLLKIQQTLVEIDLFFRDVNDFLEKLGLHSNVVIDSIWRTDPERIRTLARLRGDFSDSTAHVLCLRKTNNELKNQIKTIVSHLLTIGVIADKSVFVNDFNKRITLEADSTMREVALDEIYARNQAFDFIVTRAKEVYPKEEMFRTAFEEIAMSFVVPNLIFNPEKTRQYKEDARKTVSVYQGKVIKGEIILRPHERVTADHVIKIKSLEIATEQKVLEISEWAVFLPVLGRIVSTSLIIFLTCFYIYNFYRTKLFANNFHLLAITVIVLFTILVVYFIKVLAQLSIYLIPFATSGMLFCALFNPRLALRLMLSISMLAAIMLNYDFFAFFFAMISGSFSIYTISKVRQRSHFYRSMLILPFVNILVAFALNTVMINNDISNFLNILFLAALNGILCPVLTIGLLPLLESGFRIATDITILELSDSNHPLLRQMALQAPGSFNHSFGVGNLGEAAAKAINANSLFVRVASLYHDIGKMSKPEYFVENQRGGENPHDRLSPTMSALILKSHVKDGARLAKEHRLPDGIIDMIQQHHGTSLIKYFYDKTLKEDPDTTLTEREFRYDGPKPQTKEAGIIMLADTVEAVSRLLKEPSPGNIRSMVKRVTMDKFMSGELDECELTLNDLDKMNEAFIHVLTGIFHHRIEYPTTKDAKELPKSKRKIEPADDKTTLNGKSASQPTPLVELPQDAFESGPDSDDAFEKKRAISSSS